MLQLHIFQSLNLSEFPRAFSDLFSTNVHYTFYEKTFSNYS